MKNILTLVLLLFAGVVSAEESIDVCYNYGCKQEATTRFSERQLRTLAIKLKATTSAVEERKALSEAIGQLYYWAGQQTPISADKGGNTSDDGVDGAMDCIDHSTTTTRFLKMIERRRMLKYHDVGEIVLRRRFLLFEHYSAVIKERPRPSLALRVNDGDSDEVQPHRYVIDSWFVNNGKPAVIMPLEDWMDGEGPKVEPSA